MYEKYVLKQNDVEKSYFLELIKPEELLISAIFDKGPLCSVKFGVYSNLSMRLFNLFLTLPERYVQILKYRFGFYGKLYSLREIGKIMGVTGETVRQIEQKALNRLRHPGRIKYLLRVTAEDDEDCTQMVNLKKIIIKKIESYISEPNSEIGFLKDIFDRNQFSINLNSNTISTGNETIKEDINYTSSDDYIPVQINYKGNEYTYKFECTNITALSECIYNVLTEDISSMGTIMDYSISMELRFLLLSKGYFFVENIIENRDSIGNELRIAGYEKYANEFKEVVKLLKELNSEVTFLVVHNTIAQNIISHSPENWHDLFECFKTGKTEQDELLENIIVQNFPSNFKIYFSENVLSNTNVEIDISESETV